MRHARKESGSTLAAAPAFTVTRRSVISLDRPFDNLRLLRNKLGQMILDVVCGQLNRLISAGFILEHADGRTLTVAGIEQTLQ